MKEIEKFILENSQTKREPICKHFLKCGGCSFQHIPYIKQIKLKEKFLSSYFNRKVKVNPSPKEYFYRTRMDYVFAFNKLGLRKKGSYKHVVNLDECYLISEKVKEILEKTREILIKENISSYDYIKHKGYLRYVVFRHAKFTKQHMINFVTASKSEEIEKIVKYFTDEFDSVVWSINESKSDVSYGKTFKFWKNEFIKEKLGKKVFFIGANSFFQSNSYIALKIYQKIKKAVDGRVADLYAGSATIGIFISDSCESVDSVEINDESIKIGKKSIEENKVKNVLMVKSDVVDYLKRIKEKCKRYNFFILDPPRTGLQKAAEIINKYGPTEIVYLSCNPKTFKLDVEKMDRYELVSLEAFDMFPQTPHIELLAFLQRK